MSDVERSKKFLDGPALPKQNMNYSMMTMIVTMTMTMAVTMTMTMVMVGEGERSEKFLEEAAFAKTDPAPHILPLLLLLLLLLLLPISFDAFSGRPRKKNAVKSAKNWPPIKWGSEAA